MGKRSAALLSRLENARRDYGAESAAEVEKLLSMLRKVDFPDAASLIRAHDALLFLRAFPQSRKIARNAETLLLRIADQAGHLQAAGAGMSQFEDEEFSGIAGTVIVNRWTFECARWLVDRHGQEVDVEWNLEEQSRRMAVILPSIVPLMEDDSYVEPDTPYTAMMEAAAGGSRQLLPWLLRSFHDLPVPLLQKTGLYDGLDIELRWRLVSGSARASRTFARRPSGKLFVHDSPLISRKRVSLANEFSSADLPLRKLSAKEGQQVLDFIREVLTVRYRELHGTTHSDADTVYAAEVGRGVQLLIWGLAPEWRLPLRAYYAGCTLKNGVPVNYFEAIGLFEWLEVGFNTFYAFREGETAWIYSKILHLLAQIAGASCMSVYPYQLGHDNEEAIASGAFWFYRKLGFRPGRPELLKLVEEEEKKMARNPAHRTSAKKLRKLASGHVFYEVGSTPAGQWDWFSTRKIILAVQQRLGSDFHGDAERMRRADVASISAALQVDLKSWSPLEQQAFTQFASVLALIPHLATWTSMQKNHLKEIIRAKSAPEETSYLRLLQQHQRLREAFLKLGSSQPKGKAAAHG